MPHGTRNAPKRAFDSLRGRAYTATRLRPRRASMGAAFFMIRLVNHGPARTAAAPSTEVTLLLQ